MKMGSFYSRTTETQLCELEMFFSWISDPEWLIRIRTHKKARIYISTVPEAEFMNVRFRWVFRFSWFYECVQELGLGTWNCVYLNTHAWKDQRSRLRGRYFKAEVNSISSTVSYSSITCTSVRFINRSIVPVVPHRPTAEHTSSGFRFLKNWNSFLL